MVTPSNRQVEGSCLYISTKLPLHIGYMLLQVSSFTSQINKLFAGSGNSASLYPPLWLMETKLYKILSKSNLLGKIRKIQIFEDDD